MSLPEMVNTPKISVTSANSIVVIGCPCKEYPTGTKAFDKTVIGFAHAFPLGIDLRSTVLFALIVDITGYGTDM